MRSSVDVAKVLELNRKFHDEVEAENYDARMGVSHDAAAVNRIFDELESVRGARLDGGHVVDLGAGTGNLAIKLALMGRFAKISAVDISSVSLEVLSRTSGRLGVQIETIVSNMEKLPFPNGSVDLVVGCAFLHHLPDPASFMYEVRRVLKPNGAFVIIGEPSTLGTILTETVKLPLVIINRIFRSFTSREIIQWEHDHIDVHTFNSAEIRHLTREFSQVRLVSEGFLEPIVDQALLVAARALFGRIAGIHPVCDALRNFMRQIDQLFLNRILPTDVCVTLKFSGVRDV